MDVTPLIPADRQVIDSYGRGSFRVSGVMHEGAIIVFPDATAPWGAAHLADMTIESLAPVIDHGGVEIDQDGRDFRELDTEAPVIGRGERLVQASNADRWRLDTDGQDMALALELHVRGMDRAHLTHRDAFAPDRGLTLFRLLGIYSGDRRIVDLR